MFKLKVALQLNNIHCEAVFTLFKQEERKKPTRSRKWLCEISQPQNKYGVSVARSRNDVSFVKLWQQTLLPLCHVNNTHRLFSLRPASFYGSQSNYSVFISSYLINMSLEGALVGPGSRTVNSAVGTCSFLKVWPHTQQLRACPWVRPASFLHTVRCKQQAEDAFKNIPQGTARVCFSFCSTVWHIPDDDACLYLMPYAHMSLQAMMFSQHPPLTECCTSQVHHATTTQAGLLSIVWMKTTTLLSHRFWKVNRWVCLMRGIFAENINLSGSTIR